MANRQKLTLTLFMLWVFTNNPDNAFAMNDLAFIADLFY